MMDLFPIPHCKNAHVMMFFDTLECMVKQSTAGQSSLLHIVQKVTKSQVL